MSESFTSIAFNATAKRTWGEERRPYSLTRRWEAGDKCISQRKRTRPAVPDGFLTLTPTNATWDARLVRAGGTPWPGTLPVALVDDVGRALRPAIAAGRTMLLLERGAAPASVEALAAGRANISAPPRH